MTQVMRIEKDPTNFYNHYTSSDTLAGEFAGERRRCRVAVCAVGLWPTLRFLMSDAKVIILPHVQVVEVRGNVVVAGAVRQPIELAFAICGVPALDSLRRG